MSSTSPATPPTPSDLPDADILVYDGECVFCQRQVARLHWLAGPRLAFLSLHSPEAARLCPDLSHDQLMEQMYLVTRQGGRFGGADALRVMSRRLPLLWPLAPMLHFPGLGGLWRWLYRQVASSRYGIAGKACADGVCRLPANDASVKPSPQ